MKKKVVFNKPRVRIAPSPTGVAHSGTIRTAIYNWLFARNMGGEFFLRIEDTDLERSKKIHEQQLLDAFNWIGIDFDNFYEDGRIFRQSDRFDVYKKYALELWKKGYAFYCVCESLESYERCNCIHLNLNEGILRFKVENNRKIEFKDLVFGNFHINTNQIENFALLKKDGIATYHLAVVVDDHEMNISHVIRGDDHKTNTFKQILIYEAMNWDIPQFAHLPMLVDAKKKKLSKRTTNYADMSKIIEEGFLPEAVFNVILRMGWGKGNIDFILQNEAKKIFSLNDARTSPSFFDIDRLRSFSGYYLRKLNKSIEAHAFMEKYFNCKVDLNKIKLVYSDLVKRSNTFKDFAHNAEFLITKVEYDKNLVNFNNMKILLYENLENYKEFEDLKNFILTFNFGKDFIKELRYIITGDFLGISLKTLIELESYNDHYGKGLREILEGIFG